jgi:integrase
MLKRAVEWQLIEHLPCTIRLVPVAPTTASFDDFEEYERLVAAARTIGAQSMAIVLLGGDAGLRNGEMVALEWSDVDFERGQLTIR